MTALLRCGIIGCGVIAPLHIESYQRLPNVTVAWACDTVVSKAQALADKYAIPYVTADYHELLAADVDCVSICTPHFNHAPIAVDALNAGKHTLCEKPLASTAEGLVAMLAAHQSHVDLVFAGVCQHRFDYVYQYVRRLVQKEAFGTLLTANLHIQCLRTDAYYHSDAWRGTWAEEGGSLMINQAIHFVDSLSWVMGGVASVSAAFANRSHQGVIETEDTVAAALRFNNGALGTIAATSSSYLNWEPTITIHGTAGSLDIRNGHVTRADFADAELAEHIQRDLSEDEPASPLNVGKSYYGPSHSSQLADFVDAIREQRAPFVSAQQARHAVDIVLGIYESQRRGMWVEV